MDLSSWFRRSLLRKSEKTKNPDPSERTLLPRSEEEQQLGVTEELIDHVKSFNLDTFKNFPLPDDEGADNSPTTSSNAKKDLSEWQEKHATLVLSKAKELSHLRYKLCPGYLKEHQFWRIYFLLVKKQVAEINVIRRLLWNNESCFLIQLSLIRAACHTTSEAERNGSGE
ncbi:PREDICTED: uncharacterized protein LOC103334317 isoform X2 [Prunus mume]|uniref:Uncharacterized protein LOC103334317 isoform X2 n=1 Tax=Prunus mume TaxID=102107 RepID=A0ABM0P7K8_PRUMU|nr:PREDICTED: uncharacterized protein LOC103334317 isoform X2 [Prunus mume]